jgi:hypothetical protein
VFFIDKNLYICKTFLMKPLNATLPTTHQALAIIGEWERKYHVDKKGSLVFQNKKTLANVVFTSDSFHQCMKHLRGFENIPGCIESPDELWSKWGDANQRVTLRNYLLFGEKGNYCVQTKDGIVTDAFFVVNSQLQNYRKGLIL